MAATYNFGSNPLIDYVRMLCGDTDVSKPVFQDSEIMAGYQIIGSVFQSSQYFSGPAGRTLPPTPVNYLRCAGTLLKCLAANKSRLCSVVGLLDVKLLPKNSVDALLETAQSYFTQDDESGAFIIAEQVTTVWAFYDRFWSQWQRQQGGVGVG